MKITVRTAALAAVLIATSLVLVRPAQALPGLELVTQLTASDSTSPKSHFVTCPAGKVVIGGGAQVTGGVGNVVLNVLRPEQATNRYYAKAAEDIAGYNPNWSLKVYAVCAPSTAVPGLEYKRTNTPDTEATASCTAGKKVIGTGGEVNGGSPEAVLEDVVPAANLTNVKARTYADPGSVVTWSTIAWAICANPVPGLTLVQSAFTAGTASIACPAGLKVHGTGTEIAAGSTQHGHVVLDEVLPNAALTNVSTTAYEDKHNPPNGWSVRAYAICAT